MSVAQQNSISRKKVIFDTDGGGDDLWALLLLVAAHERGEIELLGVTTCFGNTTLENASNNVLNFLYYCGVSDIPVFKGAERTLNGLRGLADGAFGTNGLSNGKLPKSDQSFSLISANEFLKETLANTQDEITIISTGPATNLGKLFKENPELDKSNVNFTWFGGAIAPAGGDHQLRALDEKAQKIVNDVYNRGNITHAMEFNAGNDVPAVKIVTGLNNAHVTIVAMDQCQHTVFDLAQSRDLMVKMSKNGQVKEAANMLGFLDNVIELDVVKQGMYIGTPIYDALTAMYFFNPELFIDAVPLRSVDFVEKEGLVSEFLKVSDNGGFAPELLEDHGKMSVLQCDDGQISNICIVAGPYTFTRNPSEIELNAHIEMGAKRADVLVDMITSAAKELRFRL